jgi:uncharacterized membrane protein (DUF2068 family)
MLRPMSAPTTPEAHVKPVGLRLIIAYKVIKSALVLGVAVLLTRAPEKASAFTEHLIHALAERGALLHRIGEWLRAHGAATLVTDARMVAWVDGVTTGIEGALLISGRAWGEWVVVGSLALLIPAELVSLDRRFSLAKVVVIVVNVAIVAYLVHLRLRARRGVPRASP